MHMKLLKHICCLCFEDFLSFFVAFLSYVLQISQKYNNKVYNKNKYQIFCLPLYFVFFYDFGNFANKRMTSDYNPRVGWLPHSG